MKGKMCMRSLNYISLIVTKRCNAKCKMCNCHLYPTKPEEEFQIGLIDKLPFMENTTITGGEPFLRSDIEEIVEHLQGKTKRILINTNGYYTERIVKLCKKYPNVGIRVSIDGCEKTHDQIRGVPGIYQKAMKTLDEVAEIRGKHDLGIGFCVQDCNYKELLPMFQWAESKKYEFGITVVQNSEFFKKKDNEIKQGNEIINELEKLKKGYLNTKSPRKWVRAFFVTGNICMLKNQRKPLKCDAGKSSFFITPQGNILPCNDMPEEMILGNLNSNSWNEIMKSEKAQRVINICENCQLNCWSICNIGSVIKKKILKVGMWAVKNKCEQLCLRRNIGYDFISTESKK